MAGAARGFGVADFFIRFLGIFALIIATYNPTGYSFFHWAIEEGYAYIEVKIFIGLTLFLLHTYIAGIVRRAFGTVGILLAILFFVSLLWALDSQQLLPESWTSLAMLVEVIVSAIAAAGLSFVILWTQVSGQVTATVEVH